MKNELSKSEAERIALETFIKDAPDDYPKNNLEVYSGMGKDPANNGERCRSVSVWFRAETSKR
jgi:hypothetical protein